MNSKLEDKLFKLKKSKTINFKHEENENENSNKAEKTQENNTLINTGSTLNTTTTNISNINKTNNIAKIISSINTTNTSHTTNTQVITNVITNQDSVNNPTITKTFVKRNSFLDKINKLNEQKPKVKPVISTTVSATSTAISVNNLENTNKANNHTNNTFEVPKSSTSKNTIADKLSIFQNKQTTVNTSVKRPEFSMNNNTNIIVSTSKGAINDIKENKGLNYGKDNKEVIEVKTKNEVISSPMKESSIKDTLSRLMQNKEKENKEIITTNLTNNTQSNLLTNKDNSINTTNNINHNINSNSIKDTLIRKLSRQLSKESREIKESPKKESKLSNDSIKNFNPQINTQREKIDISLQIENLDQKETKQKKGYSLVKNVLAHIQLTNSKMKLNEDSISFINFNNILNTNRNIENLEIEPPESERIKRSSLLENGRITTGNIELDEVNENKVINGNFNMENSPVISKQKTKLLERLQTAKKLKIKPSYFNRIVENAIQKVNEQDEIDKKDRIDKILLPNLEINSNNTNNATIKSNIKGLANRFEGKKIMMGGLSQPMLRIDRTNNIKHHTIPKYRGTHQYYIGGEDTQIIDEEEFTLNTNSTNSVINNINNTHMSDKLEKENDNNNSNIQNDEKLYKECEGSKKVEVLILCKPVVNVQKTKKKKKEIVLKY